MEEKSIRNRVRELIIANNTDEAIELLSKAQLSAVDKQLIVLTSQYNRVREELRLDVISRDEAERKINQINLALLDLSYKVENKGSLSSLNYQPASPSGGFNRNYLWLLLLPLIAVAVYFFSPSEEPTTTTTTNTSVVTTKGPGITPVIKNSPGGTDSNRREEPPVSTPNPNLSNSNPNKGSSSSQPTTVTPPPPEPEPTPSGPTLTDLRKDPALAAYYSFDGNASADIGPYNGVIQSDRIVPTKDRNGEPGKALSFPGQDSYIQLRREIIPAFSENFSISCWIKPARVDNGFIYGAYITEERPNSGGCRHCLRTCNHCLTFSTGAIEYYELPPGTLTSTKKIRMDPNNQVPVNEWTHLAFVRVHDKDYAEVQVYLNGTLATKAFETTAWKNNYGSPSVTWIGGRSRPGEDKGTDQEYFEGDLDEFYIFNRAITAEEVKVLAGVKN